jgi:CO/xanthine dehydrogenase FAD-binding subunit
MKVSGIIFKKCTRVLDETGRFSPRYDEDEVLRVDGDVVLMAIGQVADLEFLNGVYRVETERGRIKATEGSETSVPGIFAGGDVTSGPATVIKAIAAGHKTAISMAEYMGVPIEDSEKSSGCNSVCLHHFDPISRKRDNAIKLKLLSPADRSIEKEDVLSGITRDEMKGEAARCFNCGCLAVNPSDLSNLLIAADASIKTDKRTVGAEDFFTANPDVRDTLLHGELVTEIQIPIPGKDVVMKYDKFRIREAIDFAIVALATSYKMKGDVIEDARIVMGAVAPIPMRLKKAEAFLKGKRVDNGLMYEVADIALEDALPLQKNAFKIDIAKTMVRRSLNFDTAPR